MPKVRAYLATMFIAVSVAAFAQDRADVAATLGSAAIAYDKGDHSQAVQLGLGPAEAGHPAAQYLVGSAIANRGAPFANPGLPAQQADDANGWLEKAANQGIVPAMRDAGHLNLLYRGVPNVALAAKWYQAAASLGDAEAQQMLGLLHIYGLGVPKDATTAIAWLSLSADRAKDQEQRGLSLQLLKALRSKLQDAQLREAEQVAKRWVPQTTSGFAESINADIRVVEKARESRTAKQEVEAQKHMASLPQLRFGRLVGGILSLDAVFGALLYTRGGLVGRN
jgi:TPR repeat protein